MSANGRRKETLVDQRENHDQLMNMKWMANLAVLLCLLTPILASAADNDTEEARVKASGVVLKELLNAPEGIPLSLLNKAECVIVLPSVKKAGFIVGASYGRGVMSCRSGENFAGAWSAPIM